MPRFIDTGAGDDLINANISIGDLSKLSIVSAEMIQIAENVVNHLSTKKRMG